MKLRASPLLFTSALLLCVNDGEALSLPMKRRGSIGASFSKARTGVNKAVGAGKVADGQGDIGLTTNHDLLYMADVTIGGSSFTVQLDTGSSDLWVSPGQTSISSTTPSSTTLNLTYGSGFASGSINRAQVSFAGATVQSQAFLLASQADNPIFQYGARGILGLGFTSLSSIDAAINATNNSWGRSFLFNVFENDKNTPNFISFALQRDGDPADEVDGTFTVGEYVEGFEGVQQMPSVSTFPVVDPDRWTMLLDGMFVGGVAQNLKSGVANAPAGKMVALLDSGTSLTYGDPDFVKSIYSTVPGASLNNGTGIWSLPCNVEIDVTLLIGGNPYPLHPFDMITNTSQSATGCAGSFVGQQLSVGNDSFDLLLGDNIMRNIYTIYDFGDFDSSGNIGNPYLKMLSITNATAASIDFHERLGGSPNLTISASGVDVNGSTVPSTSPTGSTVTAVDDSNIQKILNFIPALLGILAFNSLVLLGLALCAVIFFVKRGRSILGGGKGARNAAGGDYHYQRVRSQYEPRDGPGVSPTVLANANPNDSTASPRASVRGSMRPAASRNTSHQSIHLAENKYNGTPQDEPFTPPGEPEHEGDLSTTGFATNDPNADADNTSQKSSVPMPHPPSPGSPAFAVNNVGTDPYDPALIAPVPRPRFVSSTTQASSDGYGRPQSLFSVSSGQLLAPGQYSQRPQSTYDIPLGTPGRPRFISTTLSDGRPESTFSTSPLIVRSAGPDPGPGPNQLMAPGPHMTPQDELEEMNAMHPPRPRFMSDVNARQRPESMFSLGSTTGSPLRPQSKFMDVSNPRPLSEANM